MDFIKQTFSLSQSQKTTAGEKAHKKGLQFVLEVD